MKKILLPIDFSPAAETAFAFGRELAVWLGADLLAVHIFPDVPVDETLGLPQIQRLRRQRESALLEKLERFTRHYPHTQEEKAHPAPSIRCLVRAGKVAEGLIEVGKEESADLILVGVEAERLSGTLTSRLLKLSPFPLLVVPAGNRYRPIADIAYATDLARAETVSLKGLFQLAKQLDARLHRVHVCQKTAMPEREWVETMPARSLETEGSPYAQVVQIRHPSVKEGLDRFLQAHHIDLLAMYCPRRSPPEQWLHRSLTRHMIHHTSLPLLVLLEPREE